MEKGRPMCKVWILYVGLPKCVRLKKTMWVQVRQVHIAFFFQGPLAIYNTS
jgi:hypothetical protein